MLNNNPKIASGSITDPGMPAGSIFFIVNANVRAGVPDISDFLTAQRIYLEREGFQVSLGVVDDRTSISGILRNLRRLKREIKMYHPQIVHAHYGTMTAAIAVFAIDHERLIITFRGDDLLGTPNPGLYWRIRERIGGWLSQWAATYATTIITVSENLRQALPVSLQQKVAVLPNGVDYEVFRTLDKTEARFQLGWDTTTKVITFNASSGSNQKVKNIKLAQATIDLLGQKLERVRLHALSNSRREEVNLVLNASDCLIVTSLHEGSPNIVKEAMACNLPIVTVPCGDVVERLKNVQPGAICPYDENELAKEIFKILKSGQRSNGREQLIIQGLDAANIAKRLGQIYQRALNA